MLRAGYASSPQELAVFLLCQSGLPAETQGKWCVWGKQKKLLWHVLFKDSFAKVLEKHRGIWRERCYKVDLPGEGSPWLQCSSKIIIIITRSRKASAKVISITQTQDGQLPLLLFSNTLHFSGKVSGTFFSVCAIRNLMKEQIECYLLLQPWCLVLFLVYISC